MSFLNHFIKKFLGFERNKKDDILLKVQLCRDAIESGNCPENCNNCAWSVDDKDKLEL